MPKAAERPKCIKTTSVHRIYQCGGLWYSCKNHFCGEVGWGWGVSHNAIAMD